MGKKLLIIMANSDPRNGEELGAPIFQASVAAAMDYEVEVICTATSGRLMKKGVAQGLTVKPGSPKSVHDFIKDAHAAVQAVNEVESLTNGLSRKVWQKIAILEATASRRETTIGAGGSRA